MYQIYKKIEATFLFLKGLDVKVNLDTILLCDCGRKFYFSCDCGTYCMIQIFPPRIEDQAFIFVRKKIEFLIDKPGV